MSGLPTNPSPSHSATDEHEPEEEHEGTISIRVKRSQPKADLGSSGIGHATLKAGNGIKFGILFEVIEVLRVSLTISQVWVIPLLLVIVGGGVSFFIFFSLKVAHDDGDGGLGELGWNVKDDRTVPRPAGAVDMLLR
ncbi:hypothetical protein CROQUDRAFT_95732 [Cronartium quercuum f. sp. fusiforme G11]|uniref:Uncharacterized protein n=1 Tax=Cronartium quercuum f. sp. fusiforme G11 TaxID=708437 RepID=A0A9P6NC02_9BASI|nr:hypothetical protein CROQUDRAFT_95732 [Cronartium quercuum f. sp. fusiforme G11]